MRIVHLCIDIRGAMNNADCFVGCIKVDGKTLETTEEVVDFLNQQLSMGRDVLPTCDCNNFDYQTGCKGIDHKK